MVFCSYCGKENADAAAFCQFCGKPIVTQNKAQQWPTSFPSPGPATGIASPLLQAKEIVMKKKILSLVEHYDFEDRAGNKLGQADANFIQVPAKFSLRDSMNEEVMSVHGKLLSIRDQFSFLDPQGKELGVIKKKIVKLIGSEYWIEQAGSEFMRIYGRFTDHDYRFEVNKQPVAQVHMNWVTIRDTLGLSITGEVDTRLVLGATLVIEHHEVRERENRY